jgi:hypothetical protein
MEVGEIFFGEENVFRVVGEEHAPIAADEENAAVPFGNSAGFPEFGFVFALIPAKRDGRLAGAWAVSVNGDHGGRGDFGMRRWAFGFDAQRGLEFEGPKRKVVPMAAKVAHGAVTEIPPAIPFRAGKIDGMKRARGRRAEPEVPIEAIGNGLRFFGAVGDENDVFVAFGVFFALQTPGAPDPDMRFGHGANRAALDDLDDAAVIVVSVNLDTHLGGDFGFGGDFANAAGFPDVVRERLLAIDVLFVLQGEHRRESVRVLAGADDNRVEVFGVIEDFAEVGEFFCVGMFSGGSVEVFGVDVAEGNDVFGGDAPEIGTAAATGGNDGDVEFVVEVLAAKDGRKSECRAGGGGQKTTTSENAIVLHARLDDGGEPQIRDEH